MKTTNITEGILDNRGFEELHIDSLKWLAELDFVTNEIQFFKKLLRLGHYEHAAPKLAERIRLFLGKIDAISKENEDNIDLLKQHENQLKGMLECEDLSCDQIYLNEHDRKINLISKHIDKFKTLKRTIFEHADVILKVNGNK